VVDYDPAKINEEKIVDEVNRIGFRAKVIKE
jgi:hypothetical protein